MSDKIKIGLIGTGYITKVHIEAFRFDHRVELVAVCGHGENKTKFIAEEFGIPDLYYGDDLLASVDKMLARDDIDAVTVSLPNNLHAPVAIKVAEAGKHAIVEKPLATTLEDARAMIAAFDKAGKRLCYAEELCFLPKFARIKEIADDGGIGPVYMVKQSEKHAGPYSPWFFQKEAAGGGIMMDMGCHSIEWARWVLGKPKVTSVYARCESVLHTPITPMDDNIILIIEFEGGQSALLESSWALKGGMESKSEIIGKEGVAHADLCFGWGVDCFSEKGYGDDKSETTGWHYPAWEELFANGYPQEMKHFVDCMLDPSLELIESGADGLAVIEIMLAGYHSAATGRKIELPFQPENVKIPVDLWLEPDRYAID
jgi:predicted dehydrogenase